jgi:hypothetical protein
MTSTNQTSPYTSRAGIADALFILAPHLKEVEGMEDFLNKQDHIEFEKMDLRNDTNGFEKMMTDGKLNCMLAHMQMVIFDFENFKKWLATKK